MRTQISFMLIALCFLVACSDQKQETSATAETTTSDEMDRTSLPIKEPASVKLIKNWMPQCKGTSNVLT